MMSKRSGSWLWNRSLSESLLPQQQLPCANLLRLRGFELAEEVLDSTPYVVPVILDRMVNIPQFKFDPSEEVRLGHIRLLHHLLTYRVELIMSEHSQEVMTVVVAATRDTAPDVKKVWKVVHHCCNSPPTGQVALACVRPITTTVAHYSIWKQETAMLMEAVGRSLAHRHASVRFAGLEVWR